MENTPAVSFIGYNLPPEIEVKYNNWTSEVYLPNFVKRNPVNRVDRYHITKKNPDYPDYFSLWHLSNIRDVFSFTGSQDWVVIHDDIRATFSKVNWIWATYYQLMRSFRNPWRSPEAGETTMIENAPFVMVEAFRLTSGEELKYAEWFLRYANSIYVPLLLKIPGVCGFDRYRYAGLLYVGGVGSAVEKESNYPLYLHIVYFENEKAFEGYKNSPELASYLKAMKSDISENLAHQWYVQYQLVKSFRK